MPAPLTKQELDALCDKFAHDEAFVEELRRLGFKDGDVVSEEAGVIL